MLKAALTLVGLFVAVAACVGPNDESNLPAQACLASVEFVSDDARAQFVTANISGLSVAARDRVAYATANGATGDSVEFITTYPSCTEASLRAQFEFERNATAAFSVSSMDSEDAQMRLSSAIVPRRDEQYQWRCVVRTSHQGFIRRLVEVMDFVGLRTPQVEGANDNLFLAADDDCAVVSAVFLQASLRQCGYPQEIGIVPSP
jgi:hypothetical protein